MAQQPDASLSRSHLEEGKGKEESSDETSSDSEKDEDGQPTEEQKENDDLDIITKGLQPQRQVSEGKLPKLEGWLSKKSYYKIQGWQQRYCILKDKRLLYYKKKYIGVKVQGCIDFDLMNVKLEFEKGKKEAQDCLK